MGRTGATTRALGSMLWLVVGCVRSGPGPTEGAVPPAISQDDPDARSTDGSVTLDGLRMLGILDALAEDALGGRYTLHPDIERAAEVITSRYRAAGVIPATGDGYRVPFEVVVGVDDGPRTLTIHRGARVTEIDPDGYVPLPQGAAGDVEGPLVFVGHGIVHDDPQAPFDELAGVPVSGAIAVVLDGLPQMTDPDAPRPSWREGRLGRKLERLAEAGAAGVIVIVEPMALEPGVDRPVPPLHDPTIDKPVRRQVAIPVVQLHAASAKALRFGGHTLGQLQQRIARRAEPQSQVMGGMRAHLRLETTPRVREAPNLLAMIPGTDLADEIVIVGAHYDHIGTDAPGHGHCRAQPRARPQPTDDGQAATPTVTTATRSGTQAPAPTQEQAQDDPPDPPLDAICNGADDNASGSAIVAELALAMTAAEYQPRRTIVLTHFAGEEMGLLGSRALAAQLDTLAPFAGRTVVAMINVDMVGRLRERLTISGVGSSDAWMEILDEIGTHGTRVLYDRALTTRSDHAPFYERNIPALFFFTELHDDYHAPGDETDAILRDGVVTVGRMVAEITEAVADGTAVPFTPPARPEDGLVSKLPGDDPSTIIKEVGP